MMMTQKDKSTVTTAEQAIRFENSVEMLCLQITGIYNKTTDPDMAIVVDVATTDDKARVLGWPSAELMQAAINQALIKLPPEIVERIEFDEV